MSLDCNTRVGLTSIPKVVIFKIISANQKIEQPCITTVSILSNQKMSGTSYDVAYEAMATQLSQVVTTGKTCRDHN